MSSVLCVLFFGVQLARLRHTARLEHTQRVKAAKTECDTQCCIARTPGKRTGAHRSEVSACPTALGSRFLVAFGCAPLHTLSSIDCRAPASEHTAKERKSRRRAGEGRALALPVLPGLEGAAQL